MKTYGGVEVYLHAFLTSALVGGEWSASCPRRFARAERTPCTHWTGGWGVLWDITWVDSHCSHNYPYFVAYHRQATDYAPCVTPSLHSRCNNKQRLGKMTSELLVTAVYTEPNTQQIQTKQFPRCLEERNGWRKKEIKKERLKEWMNERKVNLSLCLSNTPWRLYGNGDTASYILTLGTRWTWGASFTPGLRLYQLGRRLGGPNSWCRPRGEKQKLLSRIESPLLTTHVSTGVQIGNCITVIMWRF
jgi:hypothetical protein